MHLRCVSWWKSGQVPSVAEYHLWALLGCVDSSHTVRWKYKAEGELPLHGEEIIGHRKIKNLPRKSWSNHLCPYSGVCLLPQLLFFLQRSNSHSSTGIKVLSVLFTFLCIDIENKDENALICLESSVLISKHFLCLQTQLWPFLFWFCRYKELMRPS